MLDLAGITFTGLVMLFIIVRAVRFDQVQEWFQRLDRKDGQPSRRTVGGVPGDSRVWSRR